MVTNHPQPFHLFFIEFLSAAAMARHDPVLEIFPHRFRINCHFSVNAADAADERNERGQFAARLTSLILVQKRISLPYPKWCEAGLVAFELFEQLADHVIGQLSTPVRLT